MPKKSNFKEDLRIERKNIFVITDFSIIMANVNIFRSSFIKKKMKSFFSIFWFHSENMVFWKVI